MRTWQFAVVGLALLATAGCRSDPAVPILERELRLKEDEIYRLRAVVDEFQDSASSCPERAADGPKSTMPSEPEAAAPRHRPGLAAPNGIKPPAVELPSQPATHIPDSLKAPAGSLPPGIPDVPEELQRPSKPLNPIEKEPHGSFHQPATDRAAPSDPGESDGPSLERGAGGAASRPRHAIMASQSASAEPFMPSGDSRRVAAVALNRILTGGINADDRSGDQGLLVVVEPRDRAGRTIDAPADMSVVVLDSALEGDAARVARWDFTAAETAAMFRRTGSARAIHLTTAWPADPPAHNKLHLFVRYVTADGRKLQADQPVEVALAGDRTARWNRNDLSARTSQPTEGESASESWRPNETPAARIPGPTPHTATRSDDAKSRRPVWSPERR